MSAGLYTDFRKQPRIHPESASSGRHMSTENSSHTVPFPSFQCTGTLTDCLLLDPGNGIRPFLLEN